MRQITTRMDSRTPGTRGRGSRIKGTSLGQIPTVTKTIWRADIPRAWDTVTRVAQVASVVLIGSVSTFAKSQGEQVQL
jgi:hypothetical protein